MAIPTIPQTISRGDISIYLAANNNSSGALYGARLSPTSAITIAIVTDALRWGNAGGAQTQQSLREVANYLIWLTGKYGQQAEYILNGSGGGSVIPISPTTPPPPLYFYVDDTTPVKAGESLVIFAQFIGYELQFVRGNLTQMQASNGFDTYYSWDKITGTFQCFGPASTSEPFALLPYV